MALGGHLTCSLGPHFPCMWTAAIAYVLLTLRKALFYALNIKFISGGPVVKTPRPHYRWHGFDPWPEN